MWMSWTAHITQPLKNLACIYLPVLQARTWTIPTHVQRKILVRNTICQLHLEKVNLSINSETLIDVFDSISQGSLFKNTSHLIWDISNYLQIRVNFYLNESISLYKVMFLDQTSRQVNNTKEMASSYFRVLARTKKKTFNKRRLYMQFVTFTVRNNSSIHSTRFPPNNGCFQTFP